MDNYLKKYPSFSLSANVRFSQKKNHFFCSAPTNGVRSVSHSQSVSQSREKFQILRKEAKEQTTESSQNSTLSLIGRIDIQSIINSSFNILFIFHLINKFYLIILYLLL